MLDTNEIHVNFILKDNFAIDQTKRLLFFFLSLSTSS